MPRRHLRVVTLAFLALALAGCAVPPSTQPSSTQPSLSPGEAVPLLTQPSPHPGEVCLAARISGVLTADPTYGLGLWRNGAVRGILWPHGYSARYELGGIVLINPSGRIVAREGDDVVMAGFTSDDRISHPCNEPNGVEVVR